MGPNALGGGLFWVLDLGFYGPLFYVPLGSRRLPLLSRPSSRHLRHPSRSLLHGPVPGARSPANSRGLESRLRGCRLLQALDMIRWSSLKQEVLLLVIGSGEARRLQNGCRVISYWFLSGTRSILDEHFKPKRYSPYLHRRVHRSTEAPAVS